MNRPEVDLLTASVDETAEYLSRLAAALLRGFAPVEGVTVRRNRVETAYRVTGASAALSAVRETRAKRHRAVSKGGGGDNRQTDSVAALVGGVHGARG